MLVDFKEKPYESSFQSELARLTRLCFSPDQTDEFYLGFDGSCFLDPRTLRTIFSHMGYRRWYRLVGMQATEINILGHDLNARLPPFHLNLFIQYKRPEIMTRSSAAEWGTWNRSYYRYEITDHQQRVLERVAANAGGRAAVVYASPSFYSNVDFFDFLSREQIIANSNIASVMRLANHHRFSYASPGHFGFGHSEPGQIESDTLNELLQQAAVSEGLSFYENLEFLHNIILSSLQNDDGSLNLWQKARDLFPSYSELDSPWVNHIASILSFNLAFDVRISALSV